MFSIVSTALIFILCTTTTTSHVAVVHAFVTTSPRGITKLAALQRKTIAPPRRILALSNDNSKVLTPLHQTRQKSSTVFESSDIAIADVLNDSRNPTDNDKMLLRPEEEQQQDGQATIFSYGDFAKKYPFMNNIIIASTKTAAADLLAQVVIAQTPISNVEWDRTFLFLTFGAIYSGGFQYFYQVNVFKKLFDVDKFTSQSWLDKSKDVEGLKALGAQTALDLFVLTLVYLPTFYVFKEGVFSGSNDPSFWMRSGIEKWQQNFSKDELDLIRVWMPADLICFSVPLYLRMPVRHIVSFMWTAYLSFVRGGH
mmetsp:Transcript_16833/g.31881  ORF Transcript_16833/g.31881 Transcript_16833/m.31881 type:complete len:311 (-) Transcript_16833:2493-3425(-)